MLKKVYVFLYYSMVMVLTVIGQEQVAPVDLVNPFIDTHNSRWFYFNSACRPFGMVNLSPDTDTDKTWSSGYLYDSDSIRCFSHVHAWQLAGIAVMPTTGEFKGHLGMNSYKSAFSHDDEIAKPGYHKVFLKDYGIAVELTSSTRVGFHRYTFPPGKNKSIIFDTGAYLAHGPTVFSKVWKLSDTEIAGVQVLSKTGRRPKDTPVYFVAKLNTPFQSIQGWENKELMETTPDTVQGVNVGAALFFNSEKSEEILMKVAISYVSTEQARKNLEAEVSHWISTEWLKNQQMNGTIA